MEQQPSIQDVADQLEQLLLKIMLKVLSQLRDQIAEFNHEDEMKF